jgi:hypothetical protein
MRKILTGLFLIFSLQGVAQYNWDYGLMLGASAYMGDIGGPAADPVKVQMGRLNFGAGAFLRYRVSPLISVKGAFSYIRISAADSLLKDADGRKARNLHFRNSIYEFSITPEIHVYQTKDFGRSGRYTTFFNTYLFGGIGLALHNPEAEYNGSWTKLQPVQTEGINYSTLIPVFPVGIGAHFTFKRKLRIGMETGVRITLFDYLDDVSDEYLSDAEIETEEQRALGSRFDFEFIEQHPELFVEGYRRNGSGGVRGNPDSNDWYFFTSVNVGYTIKGNSNFYRSKYSYARGKKKKRRRSRAKF